MNTKWNLLVVFALLAALAGGPTGTVLALGEPFITDAHVDFEPSIAGFPLVKAYATFQSTGTSFTCTVNYGEVGGEAEAGTVVNNNRCNGPAHTYTAVGTYTVTFTVTDNTDPLVPLTASTTVTHTVAAPYAGASGVNSGSVQAFEAAIGAPDGQYATFGATGGTLALAVGTDSPAFVTDAVLTISHTSSGPTCQVSAIPPGAQDPNTQMPVGSTVRGATATVFTLPPQFEALFINCPAVKKGGLFGVDAISLAPYTGTTRYGVYVISDNANTSSLGLALGTPDGKYATISSGYIGLMLATQPVGPGRLTVYHTNESPACAVMGFDIETGPGAGGLYGSTMPGASNTVFNVPDPISVVMVQCGTLGAKEVFSLDAVKFEPITPPDGYAMHATAVGEAILNPNASVWAPDGQYALISSDSPSFSYIQLDMGAPVTGTLTIYHTSVATPCIFEASVEVIDPTTADPTQLIAFGFLAPNAVTSTFTSPAAFRYITVGCPVGRSIGLDAVQAQPEMPKWYAARSILDPNGQGIYMTGAPDGQSSAILDTVGNPIVLDMGAPVHGQLTIYHTTASGGCWVLKTDENGTPITSLGATSFEATSSTMYVVDDFQYIAIGCSSSSTLQVDALEVVPGEITLDGYAFSVTAYDDPVKNATAALGAPDGSYATIPAGSFIILDLGDLFQGPLTITHSSTSPACALLVTDVLGPNWGVPVEWMVLGSTFSIIPIPADQFPDGIRYVVIDCSSLAQGTLDLDAVGVHPLVTTGYGQKVADIDGSVRNADYAVGAHDGRYATISAPNGTIVLYVGEMVGQPVTIYHSATSLSCNVYGVSLEGGFGVYGFTTTGGPATTITPIESVNAEYIIVDCSGLAKKQTFQLDAVEFTP